MNRKITISAIFVIFMLVAITMVSAVSNKRIEKKESPLFKIRVQDTITEKKEILKERMNNFFVNLIENKIFLYVPLIEKHSYNAPYVLSRGSPCSVKCPLANEEDTEINFTERQIICKIS